MRIWRLFAATLGVTLSFRSRSLPTRNIILIHSPSKGAIPKRHDVFRYLSWYWLMPAEKSENSNRHV